MKQEKVIRINNIKLKPDHTEAELLKAVKKALRLKNNCDIKSDIIKRSIDARHKPDIMYAVLITSFFTSTLYTYISLTLCMYTVLM